MATSTATAPATRTLDGTALPAAGTYVLDASHTTVGFSGRHLMVTKVRGSFGAVEGTIVVADKPEDSSVEVSIDASSIDTRSEQRDAHLKSPDFLDVENYPTVTFRSTKVERTGSDWLVTGDLTTRGVTAPVTLDVEFDGGAADPWGGERISFSAKGELNREDFAMTWNQALETGGVLVGKVVKLELDVQAVRQ